jgi:hypothetical protein
MGTLCARKIPLFCSYALLVCCVLLCFCTFVLPVCSCGTMLPCCIVKLLLCSYAAHHCAAMRCCTILHTTASLFSCALLYCCLTARGICFTCFTHAAVRCILHATIAHFCTAYCCTLLHFWGSCLRLKDVQCPGSSKD